MGRPDRPPHGRVRTDNQAQALRGAAGGARYVVTSSATAARALRRRARRASQRWNRSDGLLDVVGHRVEVLAELRDGRHGFGLRAALARSAPGERGRDPGREHERGEHPRDDSGFRIHGWSPCGFPRWVGSIGRGARGVKTTAGACARGCRRGWSRTPCRCARACPRRPARAPRARSARWSARSRRPCRGAPR